MAACSRKRFAVGSTEDYEEMCHLGSGSFGSVVAARHRATGELVAIKRFSEGQYSAVKQEARLLESCQGNPFVVAYRGLIRAPESTVELQLVMEYVGPSLRDYMLNALTLLPEGGVRYAMWQLLTGAKQMHAQHIVHRDIKPENIVVHFDQSYATFKICDFGLAMRMSDPPPYGAVGTVQYKAPEVLLGKTDYDGLVDTWALGCIMAELINGDALFKGTDNTDQVWCIADVLDFPHHESWPWFASTSFADCEIPPYLTRRNMLREWFPETVLSEQGFQVLSGLLTWNPDKRLTASAALKHPWFARLNARAPARKEDLPSALTKGKEQLINSPN